MTKQKRSQTEMLNLEELNSQAVHPPLPTRTPKKNFRLRVLPIAIVAITLFLLARTNQIWDSFSFGQQAHAQASSEAASTPAASSQVPSAATPSSSGATSTSAPPASAGKAVDLSLSPTEQDVLRQLGQRREELDARGRELDRREANLKAATVKIDEKISQLKSLQLEVDSLLKKYNQQEDAKMKSLVTIYEAMKPKDAARIFEQLDMVILLEVIDRMKEQKFAPILAEMDVRKASALSAELAQRRQLPPPSVTGG